jgi:hypothetical protein
LWYSKEEYTVVVMSDIPDWLWQNMVAGLLNEGLLRTTEGLLILSWVAWKNREKIADKLNLSSKPIIVPLEHLQITSKLGKVSIKAGSSLSLKWNVQEPTPPLGTRMIDEAIEFLSVLPRHL